MMSEKIGAAAEVLDAMDMEYTVDYAEDQMELLIPYNVMKDVECVIRIIVKEQSGIMGLYVFGLLENVPMRKCRQLLPLLNGFNGKYRHFRFWYDNEGDVNVAYDFPDDSPEPEKSVKEAIEHLKLILSLVMIQLKVFCDVLDESEGGAAE